jgi:hypothetical protein
MMNAVLNRSPLLLQISVLLITAITWPGISTAAQLTLTWQDNATNEDGFEVERKTGTTGTFAPILPLKGPNVTSHTDSSLASGITYCYRVRAFNAAGDSSYSNQACGTTPTSTQNFTITVSKSGNGGGTVTSSPTGINCGSSCSATYSSGTAVTLTATRVSGSAFSGWSGGGCSGTSTCIIIANANISVTATFTRDTSSPTTPANLTATATSSSRINLRWTASTDNRGVTGYRVERCKGNGCTNFTQIATPTGTTYSNAGLQANTKYRYRIRATDAAGNFSPYSNTATATTMKVSK